MAQPPTSADRAIALIRELEALRTTAPEVPARRDRLLARGFDAGLAMVAGGVVFGVHTVIETSIWGRDGLETLNDPANEPSAAGFALAIAAAVVWLVAIVLNESGIFGRGRQTLGMRFLGIQVVDAEGPGTPGPLRMAARGLTPLAATAVVLGLWPLATANIPVATLAPLFLAAVLLLAFAFLGRNGRGLHDHLWHTRLIRPR